MASAFGIAASVAGIVSLGLELCPRIITYVDAVRHSDEEINAIHRQIKTLQTSLDILKNAVPDLASKHQTAGNAVLAALKSGELDLEALKDFVEKLTDSGGQSQNRKPNFKHAAKKMAFPFHRGNLEALQQRLDRANVSLGAATHTLGLVIVSSIDQSSAGALNQLSSLTTTLTANNTTSLSIKTSLDTFIPQVDQTLLEIQDSLRTNLPYIQKSFDSMSATISRQEETLTRKIQEIQTEFVEGPKKRHRQGNSPDLVMTSLDMNPANTTLESGPFGGASGLSNISNGLVEEKESDPPRTSDMTAEQRVLSRLISSPTQLEKLRTFYRGKDDVEYEFTIEQRDEPKLGLKRTPGSPAGLNFTTKRYMSNCICRQHHESLRRQAYLGNISVSMLSRISWKHLPECRYAKSEVVSKSNSIRLSYHGLRWLFSKAVDISISLSTGLEGPKISPHIAIRPIVDKTQAPIFRSLALLCTFLEHSRLYIEQDMLVAFQFVDVVAHRIVRQYMSRRSSPYEVDNEGQSVLHAWVDVVYHFARLRHDCDETITAMTNLLLEVGLPAHLDDDQGLSPGIRLLKKDLNSAFSLKGLTRILCAEAPEVSIFENIWPGDGFYRDPEEIFLRLRNTTEAIEILGCGPLSSAILLGNEAKVGNIIALYPSTMRERNLVHQTPFHLAVDKPRILRLLMNAARSQEFDRPDPRGKYALDYALRLTPALCSNGSSWVACSGCPCVECVEVLLEYGWRCRFDFLRYCDSKMSHTARLKMINHLVSERAVLQALGRQFLPLTDVDCHRLGELSVLDNHAHRVAELLLQEGISIPVSVRATLLPQLGCGGLIQSYGPFYAIQYHIKNCLTLHTSVYHTVCHTELSDDSTLGTKSSNRLVELLYDKGFRDIDQVDTHGHSPLSLSINHPGRCPRPSYTMWLIEHGANILRSYPLKDTEAHEYSYGTYTIAQFILYCSPGCPRDLCAKGHLDYLVEPQPHEVESYRQLFSLVGPIDRHDECHCQCVEAGCHTMKALFEIIWAYITNTSVHIRVRVTSIESTSIVDIAEKISKFLRSFALDLSKWDRVTKLGLRYFTFEVLELRHTCCHMPFTEHNLPEEDIMEIEDEDREKLDLLERLLQDFQIAYCNFKLQDGQGDAFTNFLTTEWSTRMQQELARIESIRLTPDERLKAEEIGIRWGPVLEDEEDEEDEESLDYWLKRLDEIMPA
ncbi:hypothetical protein GGR58DRAFT_491002 [Xylaria digitata]|nr:hypothetical protein GGR58DRAFT_491002 [Xylaria digitata]